MKSPDEEVLEILEWAPAGLPVTRITQILRSKHRGEKYRIRDISNILRKLEKKGLARHGKTKYNITIWMATERLM